MTSPASLPALRCWQFCLAPAPEARAGRGYDGYGTPFTFSIPALHSRNGDGRPKFAADDAA